MYEERPSRAPQLNWPNRHGGKDHGEPRQRNGNCLQLALIAAPITEPAPFGARVR